MNATVVRPRRLTRPTFHDHSRNFPATFSGTASNADLLAGTILNVLEEGGQLDIFLLSTATDTSLTVQGPDAEPVAVASRIPQETRAIRPQDDLPLSVPLRTGGHYIINIGIVTAGTWQAMVVYRKPGVDF